MSLIGLDIGGSKIEGIFWKNGKILRSEKLRTPTNRSAFFHELRELVKRLSAGEKFVGVGVSIAGAYDHRSHKMLSSPNIRFLDGLPLEKIFAEMFGKKILLENDTNCFLRAEMHFGQAKNKKNVIGMIIGTGVGGALLVDGKLTRGHHGIGAELGRIVISQNKRGKLFTLEDLISGHGFERLGVRHPLEAQRLAEGGNKKAKAIFDEIGTYLGVALVSIIHIFNPELILLGGGISRAGDLLVDPAVRFAKKNLRWKAKYFPKVKVSRLKHSGALGAVAMFLDG